MTVYNQVAKKSNQIYSSQIDTKVTVVYQKKLLRELEDYMIALPSDAIEYADNRLANSLCRSRRYNFSSKRMFLILQFLHTVFTICNLVHQITSMLVIDDINDRFFVIDDIGLSFRMLSSIKKIYELIDQECLTTNSTTEGSNIWKQLFCNLKEGYY